MKIMKIMIIKMNLMMTITIPSVIKVKIGQRRIGAHCPEYFRHN